MQKRNAKFLAPMAMLSAAVLAVSAGLAFASGTSTSGEVNLYEADTHYAGSRGTVVITGVITDHGTDHQGAGPGGSNLLVLSKGSFAVDVSDVGTKLGALPLDTTTCSSDGTVSGSLSIVPGSGTGAYVRIKPATTPLEATASAAFILPRLKNGTCDTNAAQYPGVLIVNGSGNVS